MGPLTSSQPNQKPHLLAGKSLRLATVDLRCCHAGAWCKRAGSQLGTAPAASVRLPMLPADHLLPSRPGRAHRPVHTRYQLLGSGGRRLQPHRLACCSLSLPAQRLAARAWDQLPASSHIQARVLRRRQQQQQQEVRSALDPSRSRSRSSMPPSPAQRAPPPGRLVQHAPKGAARTPFRGRDHHMQHLLAVRSPLQRARNQRPSHPCSAPQGSAPLFVRLPARLWTVCSSCSAAPRTLQVLPFLRRTWQVMLLAGDATRDKT